jgi:hypothetical protein
MGLYNLTNRMIILLLLLILSTMTLVYCIKLIIVTMIINKNRIIRLRKESNYVIPILLISSLVIIRGFLIINYLLTLLLKRATIEGLLWFLLMLIVGIFMRSMMMELYPYAWFYMQSLFLDYRFIKRIFIWKRYSLILEISVLESSYNLLGLILTKRVNLGTRTIIPIILTVLALLLLR